MNASESQKEYRQRINIVQDYIEKHLDETFSLTDLSKIAGFSKFHFHRIFKAITGESLLQYINRIKLEKSTHLLSHRLDLSITDIAYYFGFTDSAIYSRSFKSLYNVSPNTYRKQYRKNCKDRYDISRYNKEVSDTQDKELVKALKGNVEIKTMDALAIAYIRFTGSYGQLALVAGTLMETLFSSAKEQGLLKMGATKILSIYHDHPEFTEPEHWKTSIGITLTPNTTVAKNSNLCSMEIPAGEYFVGHFYLHQHQYSAAWDYMYEEWLTNSGYVPTDSFPFEMYMNDARSDPNHKHLVDIYLPVQPL